MCSLNHDFGGSAVAVAHDVDALCGLAQLAAVDAVARHLMLVAGQVAVDAAGGDGLDVHEVLVAIGVAIGLDRFGWDIEDASLLVDLTECVGATVAGSRVECGDAGHLGAAIEHTVGQAGQTLAQRDVCQVVTPLEGIVADSCYGENYNSLEIISLPQFGW